MLYSISGKLIKIESTFAVIQSGGVGYKLTVSKTTLDSLSPAVMRQDEEDVTLYTYLAVRDDSLELFGFSREEELDLFKLLTSVSGIGPKVAMSILSVFTPSKLSLAVSSEDTRLISTAPGVGAKTAARIILELKDKLAVFSPSDDFDSDSPMLRDDSPPSARTKQNEAINALVSLGYSRADALNAVRRTDTSLPLEEIIRSTLKSLMKG